MRKIELETEDIIGIILAIVVAGFLIFALIDKKEVKCRNRRSIALCVRCIRNAELNTLQIEHITG